MCVCVCGGGGGGGGGEEGLCVCYYLDIPSERRKRSVHFLKLCKETGTLKLLHFQQLPMFTMLILSLPIFFFFFFLF